MNQQQLQNYTNSMIDLLSIKIDKNGFYSTSWGKKSFQGLQETFKSILQQNGVDFIQN
jgi:hypothetical protein